MSTICSFLPIVGKGPCIVFKHKVFGLVLVVGVFTIGTELSLFLFDGRLFRSGRIQVSRQKSSGDLGPEAREKKVSSDSIE